MVPGRARWRSLVGQRLFERAIEDAVSGRGEMMSKQKRKITSYMEETHLSEPHDREDRGGGWEEIEVRAGRSLKMTYTIRLGPETVERLREIAGEKGIGPTTLARMWILEKLKEVEATGLIPSIPMGFTPASPPETKNHGLDRDELVPELREALSAILKDRPVKLAYLYGSVVTGFTTSPSDIDIALVTDQAITHLEHLDLISAVELELAERWDVRRADVRVINDAPLVFRGRVVSEGILLFARDEATRIEFETTTRDEYFDYLPVHRQLQEAFFADVRKRGLHG